MAGSAEGSTAVEEKISSPIVANIPYPLLKKLGKQNIRKFLTERDAYVREIAERSVQGNGVIGRPVSLTFSVDPTLLLSLVELRLFGAEVPTVASVTDAVLLNWLEGHRDLKQDGLSATKVQAIVSRSLRINMMETDSEQRIIMLFTDYKSLLRIHGLSWLVEENTKLAVEHIIDALKPSILKKRIKDDLTLGHINLKKDFLGFMKHVIARAEHYADYEEPEKTSSPAVKTPAGTGPASDLSATNLTKVRVSPSPTDKLVKEGKGRAIPDCLNPDCSSKHYLKECTNTSQERKEELYFELAERRKRNGEQRATRQDTRTASAVSLSPQSGTSEKDTGGTTAKVVRDVSAIRQGRLKISFQSGVDAIALPDSGADDNVIPRSLVRSLEAKGVFVPLRTMETPVSVELAFQSPGLKTEVSQQAQLTVELHLAAGPLRLRNCKWLVVEHGMDEILLGRPLLEALGLNAQEHLSTVRHDFHNMDCSHVQSLQTGGKLTRLLLREPPIAGTTPVGGNKPHKANAFCPPELLDLQAGQQEGDSVTYGEQDTDPVEVPQLLDLPAPADDLDLAQSFAGMITVAKNNGLPDDILPILRLLLAEFSDIWSPSLQGGPPANLPPLSITLKPGATPVRVRLRRYSQEQREFLARFVAQLEAAGLVYRNPRAAWCAAPLLVPKPGPAQFRFTVDLRPVNRQTVPCSWPMPHVESELAKLCGSTCFATFDLSHGYWQLPLAPESQECQSFITPDGVYSPTRVLHGTTNAVTHMQSVLQGVFDPLAAHLLAWLDDLLLHASSAAHLLDYLRIFFTLCREFRLKLHPDKCVLYAKVIRWCGRLISAEGSKFDPRRIQGLLEMPHPVTGADLQQFTCAINWMRTAIPSFSTLVAPLHGLLEAVYRARGVAGPKRRQPASFSLMSDGRQNMPRHFISVNKLYRARLRSHILFAASASVFTQTHRRTTGPRLPRKSILPILTSRWWSNATNHLHSSRDLLRALCAGGP
jgi:hypothetical protein